jgi:hypothetical protein
MDTHTHMHKHTRSNKSVCVCARVRVCVCVCVCRCTSVLGFRASYMIHKIDEEGPHTSALLIHERSMAYAVATVSRAISLSMFSSNQANRGASRMRPYLRKKE